MKRGLVVLTSLCALLAVAYFTASKWAIRHETLTLTDVGRDNRPIVIDIGVRRDKEMQANAGMIKLPVAILSHGERAKFTEYTYLANVFAARGYIAVSIQHDLETDEPLGAIAGYRYAGREPVYERGAANILFVVDKLKLIEPNADYDHLTLVGHSNGGDISMYFARLHPDRVKRVVTLDNLQVPLSVIGGKFDILTLRAESMDTGIIPDQDVAAKSGIKVVKLKAKHDDLTDRGPDNIKSKIQSTIDELLGGDLPPPNEGADLFELLVWYALNHTYIFIGAVLTVIVTVSALLLRESTLASKFFMNRNRRAHFSQYFARKFGRISAIGGILLGLAICFASANNDTIVQWLSVTLLSAVGVRYFLTQYRAKRGYLGTNAMEAEELIGFIAKQYRDGDLPPDMRKLFEDARQSEGTALEGVLEGST